MDGSGFTPTNPGRKMEFRLYIKMVATRIAGERVGQDRHPFEFTSQVMTNTICNN
jgi:hypothetical protein